jgi:nickel-dependent lactate racemase
LTVAAHGHLIFVSDAENGGAVKRLHKEIRGLSIAENAVVRFGQKRSFSGLRILALSLSQSNAESPQRLTC